jgi:hypothetical protein
MQSPPYYYPDERAIGKYVRCPCCGYQLAQVKENKKGKLYLRCDWCKLLLFANGMISERWLEAMPKSASPWESLY